MKNSYAQNFEDVLLDRCFADVGEGVYVDVGAAGPVAHSVTMHFYLKGWRGLNVEPIPERAAELRWARPRDVVVEAAASDRDGVATLRRTAGGGALSSLATRYLGGRDDDVVWPIEVRTRRLDDLLTEAGFDEPHFLKIDVEGAEAEALAGLDLRRRRPVVIVVEAMTPTDPPLAAHGAYEPALLAAGYDPVFFDGLNRFYLRRESEALRPRFDRPACVFDGFRRFEDLGDPLENRSHPDHVFAVRTAKLALRALAAGLLPDLASALARDFAPSWLGRTADTGGAALSIRHLLSREPAPGEAERLANRAPSVGALFAELIRSDEFRASCARAAA